MAYDRTTRALIRDVLRASRSSQSAGLQENADGSVDIYFGPLAPAGEESNWVATETGGHFMFRAYGPEKTWKLPDIDRGVPTPATFTRFLCPGSPRT